MAALIILILALALLAVMTVNLTRRHRHMRALMELAQETNLNFSAEDIVDVPTRYHRLRQIHQGHHRHAWDLVYGTCPQGLIAIFAYCYDRGFGARKNSHAHWMAVMETPVDHGTWLLTPGNTAADATTDAWPIARDLPHHRLYARNAATLRKLDAQGLPEKLACLPPDLTAEASQQMLAVTADYVNDVACPRRLLSRLCELIGQLEEPAPDKS